MWKPLSLFLCFFYLMSIFSVCRHELENMLFGHPSFPEASLHMFGSSGNGTALTNSSDMDIYIKFKKDPKKMSQIYIE